MKLPKMHTPAPGEWYPAKGSASGFELSITVPMKEATMWKAEQGKGK